MSGTGFFKAVPALKREGGSVSIRIDDRACTVRAGLSVAAALLEQGAVRFRRTPVSGAPRAPLCMMGVCFECLLEIDGVANSQSCLIEVRDGMRIRTQDGAARLASMTEGTAP